MVQRHLALALSFIIAASPAAVAGGNIRVAPPRAASPVRLAAPVLPLAAANAAPPVSLAAPSLTAPRLAAPAPLLPSPLSASAPLPAAAAASSLRTTPASLVPAAAAPAAVPVPAVLPPAADGAGLERRLGEVRESAGSGRLTEASQGLSRIFDRLSPSRAAHDAPSVPAGAAGRGAAPLAPAQPAWAEGVFLPRAVEKPLPGDPLGVTVHRLRNGMTVYLSPNKQESRVSFKIAVRSGSRHDPPDATGMAHYLEHMQFKGSSRLGTVDYAKEKVHLDRIEQLYDRLFTVTDKDERAALYARIDAESQAAAQYAAANEFDKIYAASGFTEINAHTNYEETVYHGSFPSNKAEVWARVESDRITDPVYRIFLPELEAVYEEYNQGTDDADRAFWQAGFAALYEGHPYGRSVIGLGEHLKNPSISKMNRFFRENYRPNNMAIVLSGDFEPAAMLKLIEENFGRLEPAKMPAPPAGAVRRIEGVKRTELRYEAEEAVQVDWQVPGRSHPDSDALELADKLLENLLNVRLAKAQKTNYAGTYLHRLNEAGGWLTMAFAKNGQTLEEAEQKLLDEVARLKAGDFTDADLETAHTQLEVKRKKALEKNEERAAHIADSFIAGQEWERAAGDLARLKALTREDVLRVANRYLGPDRAVIYRRKGLTPSEKVAKPVFTDVPIDTSRQSAFFKELATLPAKPMEPRFLREGRDYGIQERSWGRLYGARNPVNDLFRLQFRFDRGNLHERRLDLALELLNVSGAGGLDAEQFQSALDKLGSTMEFWCGDQECTITLTGLEEHLAETVALAQRRFAAPHVAPGAFDRLIDVVRGQRADGKLDPEKAFQALEQFASRGRESTYLLELKPAELDALTERELKSVLASVFTFKRDVLYTGSRSAREAAALITKSDRRRAFKAPPPSRPVRVLQPARPRVIFVHKEGMQQALIGSYAPDGPVDPAAGLDYRFYHTVMGGGMGGVYFQEVREARALAYAAQGGYVSGERSGDDNRLRNYAGTQADKAVKTARLLLELMLHPPITPERFAIAREQVEAFFRSEVPQLSQIPEKVRQWRRFGYATDSREAAYRRFAAYGRRDLDAFTGRFKDKVPTLYVLGDRGSVDIEGLKALGEFEERSIDELFPY